MLEEVFIAGDSIPDIYFHVQWTMIAAKFTVPWTSILSCKVITGIKRHTQRYRHTGRYNKILQDLRKIWRKWSYFKGNSCICKLLPDHKVTVMYSSSLSNKFGETTIQRLSPWKMDSPSGLWFSRWKILLQGHSWGMKYFCQQNNFEPEWPLGLKSMPRHSNNLRMRRSLHAKKNHYEHDIMAVDW